jgi:hypothetical protein
MANIIINTNTIVLGRLTVVRAKDNSSGKPMQVISGQLATHKYFEEIFQIETDRYILKGVDIIQEAFGSEDFDILYTFTAKDIDVIGGESIYSEDEIKKIEDKKYDTKGGVKNE